jgi:hypothetical protein
MPRPSTIQRFPAIAAVVMTASACSSLYNDPTREGITDPSEYDWVRVFKYVVSDPVSLEVFGEPCVLGTDSAFQPGIAARVSVPLEREYQIDMENGYVDGATLADHTHEYYCALADLEPSVPWAPSCMFSEKSDVHELLQYEVYDADGSVAAPDKSDLAQYAGPGGFERYRVLSHQYGLIRVKTSRSACFEHATGEYAPDTVYDLLTIEPPESSL